MPSARSSNNGCKHAHVHDPFRTIIDCDARP
jgi:hypothetical protein